MTRRELLLTAAAAAPLAAQKGAEVAGPKPNLLFIVLEDVPAWVLGCYGNKVVQTPSIDSLSREGVKFQNHIACTPVGAISLATLLTGLTPTQHGFHDATQSSSLANVTMLSDALSNAGYQCGFSGQWRFGASHHLTNGSADEFLTKQSAGQPFFLTVSYGSPFAAKEASSKWKARYENADFESFGGDPPSPHATMGKENLTPIEVSLRKYSAALSEIDEQIGSLIKKLRTRADWTNTIVVLTSSNGYMLGRHGIWGDGLSSKPVNLFEEVVRVPLIWTWPGKIPVEASRAELVSTYDFVPTIAEAIGIAAPPRITGRSYLQIAQGKIFTRKDARWRSTVYGQLANAEMARHERFKLVLREGGEGHSELYDLPKDARERTNLFDSPNYITIREQLTKELAAWRSKQGA